MNSLTPKALLHYLDSLRPVTPAEVDDILTCEALRKLDTPSLHKLENLLHHWYVLVGDLRRARAKGKAAPPAPAPDFTLTPMAVPLAATGGDEHALYPGI